MYVPRPLPKPEPEPPIDTDAMNTNRCTHTRIELAEEFEVASVHWIEDGEIIKHYNDLDGEYTGRFSIKCHDCQRVFNYSSFRVAPKWAQRAWRIATEQQEKV